MSKRVLCVMERPELEKAALRELDSGGFKIDFATGRAAAVQMNEDTDYDVILLDQEVDGKRGVDLVRELECGVRLPCSVLLCCHAPTIDDVYAALDVGMDHVVTKPLQPAEIQSLVAGDLTESARTYDQRFAASPDRIETEDGMIRSSERMPCEFCSRLTSWHHKQVLLYFCSLDCLTRYRACHQPR